MKNKGVYGVFEIFMCYVGAVIGAGFASGQEIMSFFIPHGIYGLFGICLCGGVFFAYGYIVLKKIFVCDIRTFAEYFEDIAGKSAARLIQAVAYGFMFASFCVMVSGSGAVAEEFFGAGTAGILFMALLCFFIFARGVGGMVAVNAVMTPLIALGIIALGIYTAVFKSTAAFFAFSASRLTDNFAVSALVYVSYNTVTLIGVFLPLKNKITSLRTAFVSSALSGGVLALMGALLWFAIITFKSELGGASVPMLKIAENAGSIMKYAYGAVLYMAMITTASSSGFALVSLGEKHLPVGRTSISALLCAASVPLAYVGFDNLVNKLYRFFGFLGLFVLFAVLLDGLKLRKYRS